MPTRRDFLAAAAAIPVAVRPRRCARTIQEIIDLCTEVAPGAPWQSTVDTVKAGDTSQEVRGIVTTFLATTQVIGRAVQLGANLIITHEPTYYNHLDEADWLQEDPVYRTKRRILEEHGIVVWRFHDYWHARSPDGIAVGVLQQLGWEGYAEPGNPGVCVIPATPLSQLTLLMKRRFGAQRVRVMGPPELLCSRVGLLVGAVGGRRQIEALREVDALVVGEVREWETTEYVRDGRYAGQHRGLIAVGHALSEEPGMKYLAAWLSPRVPEVKVRHVPAGDPFRYI